MTYNILPDHEIVTADFQPPYNYDTKLVITDERLRRFASKYSNIIRNIFHELESRLDMNKRFYKFVGADNNFFLVNSDEAEKIQVVLLAIVSDIRPFIDDHKHLIDVHHCLCLVEECTTTITYTIFNTLLYVYNNLMRLI